MEIGLEALAGRTAKIKITYDAVYYQSLLEKYADRSAEEAWEEVGSKIEFSYFSVTEDAEGATTVILRAEFPGEDNSHLTASGAAKVYFR